MLLFTLWSRSTTAHTLHFQWKLLAGASRVLSFPPTFHIIVVFPSLPSPPFPSLLPSTSLPSLLYSPFLAFPLLLLPLPVCLLYCYRYPCYHWTSRDLLQASLPCQVFLVNIPPIFLLWTPLPSVLIFKKGNNIISSKVHLK